MSLNLSTDQIDPVGSDAATKAIARSLINQLASGASLVALFTAGVYAIADEPGDELRVVSDFHELIDVQRDGEAYNPNWSGRSGDEFGRLDKVGKDKISIGTHGPYTESGSISNLLRNPRGEGAEGSTPPTYWSNIGTGGLTRTYKRGRWRKWPYVDITYSGTFAGANAIAFEATNWMSVNQGAQRTTSVGIQLVRGSLANVTDLRIHGYEYNAAGTTAVGGHYAQLLGLVDDRPRRFIYDHVMAAATAERYAPALFVNGTGVADFTLRVFLPQAHWGGMVGQPPVMPDVGDLSMATRPADVLSGLSVSRPSWGSYPDWDFKNGTEVRSFREFRPGVARLGRRGLLVEQTTTNGMDNPRWVGAASGVWPTGFAVGATGGMTWASEGVVRRDGVDWLQVRVTGTAAGDARLDFMGLNFAAAAGDALCSAMSVRVIDGALPGLVKPYVRTWTSGSSSVDFSLGSGNAVDGRHRRFCHVLPTASATTAFATMGLYLDDPSGTVDCTILIGLPQLEKKGFPTSPALPEPGVIASATRGVETITMPLGAWFNQNSWTMLLECQYNMTETLPVSTPFLVSLRASGNTYGVMYQSGGTSLIGTVYDSGVYIGVPSGTMKSGIQVGDQVRGGLSYAPNAVASVANGGTAQSAANGVQSQDYLHLDIGNWSGGSHPCCFIQSLIIKGHNDSAAEMEAAVA